MWQWDRYFNVGISDWIPSGAYTGSPSCSVCPNQFSGSLGAAKSGEVDHLLAFFVTANFTPKGWINYLTISSIPFTYYTTKEEKQLHPIGRGQAIRFVEPGRRKETLILLPLVSQQPCIYLHFQIISANSLFLSIKNFDQSNPSPFTVPKLINTSATSVRVALHHRL
jgi:hypothetical protein